MANASLLDESTAAAEAMHMFFNNRTKDQKKTMRLNSLFPI
jgi:glycine dehydrogenase